jgi:hypothetical protein
MCQIDMEKEPYLHDGPVFLNESSYDIQEVYSFGGLVICEGCRKPVTGSLITIAHDVKHFHAAEQLC